jgi:cysteine desulfurase
MMGVLFHTDAAQAFGKIPLDVNEMNIDLMSISGHKIYGPKGIGALYVRKDVKVIPLMDGGGQENGLRSGTLSPALCAGLGEAAKIALTDMEDDLEHVSNLSNSLLSLLKNQLNNICLNGSETDRYLGNLNITFIGLNSSLFIADLKNIAVSSGSACSSAKNKPSYVLNELGLSKNDISSSIRIGIGRITTKEEIDFAAKCIIECVQNLPSK